MTGSELKELISADELSIATRRLAREIGEAHPGGVILIGVLKGSVWFLSDLIREMDVDCRVDFLAISPYKAGTGRVKILKDLDLDISGEDVVLVEDIVDTGLTLVYLLGELTRREPRSLEVCTLLDRKQSRIVPVNVTFTGFEAPGEYLLGYGLDHGERYRNLSQVFLAKPSQIDSDPQRFAEQVFFR